MIAFRENTHSHIDFPVSLNISKNFNYLAHYHPTVEMAYVIDGNIKIGINSKTQILLKDSLIISSSMDIHHYASNNMESTIMILMFDPELIGCTGGWPVKDSFCTPFITKDYLELNNIDEKLLCEVKDCFNDIYKELNEKKNSYRNMITSDIYKVCGLVERNIPLIQHKDDSKNYRLYNLNNMKSIINYIDKNLKNEITLKNTAEKFNFSEYYFSRLFKNIVGINFTKYVNTKKVYAALNLLGESNKSITEVAYESGFRSIRTFNRVFKTITGHSPSEYK